MSDANSNGLVRRLQNVPLITFGIIALNALVFALTLHDARYYFGVYGLIPSHFRIGRLLTSNFFHDGPAHLAINMLLLYVFGRDVERAMGKLEYLIFYVGACFTGSLLHIGIVFAALPPYYADLPVVGASGSVAAVMGVFAVRFHRKSFRFAGMEMPALVLIMCWMVLQLGLGILGLYRDEIYGLALKQVSYWSHLGGFGFGVAVALAANMALQGEREYLTGEARRNSEAGNLLEAIQNFETLTKYDPDNAEAYAGMGRLWAMLGEENQSIPNYQWSIELYLCQGREERALEAADEMRRYWPDASVGPETLYRFASYLEEAGKYERAVEQFRRIAEAAPETPEAEMSLLKVGHLQLSALADAQAARAAFEAFLDRYPSSAWRHFAGEVLAGMPRE